jgi:hypothetical protein
MQNKRYLNLITIIAALVLVVGIGVAVTQHGKSNKAVSTELVTSKSSSKAVSKSSSAKTSSTVKQTTVEKKVTAALAKNKSAAKVQTMSVANGVLSIVLKDDTKVSFDNYLGSYATAVNTIVSTAKKDKTITSVQIARNVALTNGSEYAAATYWSGDQLKNFNLSNGSTFADTLKAATRYVIGGTIWSTYDQKAKNDFTNHITGGQSGDEVQSFTDWVNAGTVQK